MEKLTHAVSCLQDSLLFNQPLPKSEQEQVLQTIRSSFNPDKPYLGFVPEKFEKKQGLQIPGGEKMHTMFGAFNVLGLEAARLLRIFGQDETLENILPEIEKRIKASCFSSACTKGECAHATIALWRYQAAGGLSENLNILDQQLQNLQTRRQTFGYWKGFPFYYTLLTLTELQNPLAEAELKAVEEACSRRLKRNQKKEEATAKQRLFVLEKALEKIH